MTDAAIRTERLTKRFGRVTALDGLDLEVPQGEVFGFLGPNGAGKSTTIRLLLGLIRPTAGRAWMIGCRRSRTSRGPTGTGLRPRRRVAVAAAHRRRDPATCSGLSGRRGRGLPRRAHRRLRPRPRPAGPLVLQRQPAEGRAGRGVHDPPGRASAGRAHGGARPAHGGGVPGPDARGRRRRADGVPVLAPLDEVEDVCERVGILRGGRLVEVATLEDLRGWLRPSYEATLDGPVPSLGACPG